MDNNIALANLRVKQAAEELRVVELLIDAQATDRSIVNRLYYACFYAVSAVLVSRGYRTTTHNGVRALFSRHFVQTGDFDASFGRFFSHLFDTRLKGDYDNEEFDVPQEELVRWRHVAEDLLKTVHDYLESEKG
jgi:uncharacterized protein (UPF0332 family)